MGTKRIAFYAGRLLVGTVLLRRIVKPPVYIGVVYIPSIVQGLYSPSCSTRHGLISHYYYEPVPN
jgi:hypothetical protein